MTGRILKNDWHDVLGPEFEKPYYQALRRFLIEEYRSTTVYPDMYDIYNAFHYTPYASVKVVILGQDPYPGPNQAHGLAFSVRPGVEVPPSLANIFKELEADLGLPRPKHGHLVHWARQGVLLLNAVLTVRAGQPGSHRGKGWEKLTDAAIAALGARPVPTVFFLWGRDAQAKRPLITYPGHLVLTAPHPSPLSAARGFFGSRPFSKANQFLEAVGRGLIDWRLPETPEADEAPERPGRGAPAARSAARRPDGAGGGEAIGGPSGGLGSGDGARPAAHPSAGSVGGEGRRWG
ncbi:uracil-DNA glycosylase [Hydrogenibacillus schlegelii]